MKIIIEITDFVVGQVVKSIMENMPENCSSMDCINWDYEGMNFKFKDYEDGKVFQLGKDKLMETFPLMFTDKWPKGCTPLPCGNLNDLDVWNDWLCQADATDFDAFVQLACFGEVIYG